MSSTESDYEVPANMKISPPRKRVKKNHLTVENKKMIFNVYTCEISAKPTLVINDIVTCVSEKTGVSVRSVYKVISEYKQTHNFTSPNTNNNRKKTVDLVDDFDRNAIARKVYQFCFRNETPTVDKVLSEVNDDEDLPNFKRSTFYKVLKSLNFRYEYRRKNCALLDKDEIILARRDYLKKIKAFRYEGKKIYYVGETRLNADHATGLKNPSGKGNRLIICHIGSSDGFVPDALWSFESKNNEEMVRTTFENWFSNVLPKLQDNSVIVMGNAPYHSRKLENIPTMSSEEADIQEWLLSKNIVVDADMSKVELLEIVEQQKPQLNKYVIDEMASEQNKIVLRLPPYHCELNPIEFIWLEIKNYVASKNTTFKFDDRKKLFDEAVETVSQETWRKCIRHVTHEVEVKMCELDPLIEIDVVHLNSDFSH